MTLKKKRNSIAAASFSLYAKRIVVLAAGVLLSACATYFPQRQADVHINPGYNQIQEELSKEILALMRKDGIPGVSIALINDQKTVWAQGFGYANLKQKIPATTSTVYRMGSISKLFTDTAVMQLAEQGRVDIDKPLATYIPGFSIRSRFVHSGPITPRNIMTHHSGLPGAYLKGMWGDPEARFTQLPALIKNEYVAYPPNEIFAYSNLGLSLLGIAVQNVSRQQFVSYMDRRLLQPMGMAHSSFELTPTIRPLLSKAYDASGKVCPQPVLRDLPAGGLYSNVQDMARFAKMVFAGGRSNGHRILESRTLSEMLQPQNQGIALDVGFHIGLGWLISGQNQYKDSGPVVWHGGDTFHFASVLMLMPERKLGVVVLSNSLNGAVAVNQIATQVLRAALAKKTGIQQPLAQPVPKRAIAQFPQQVLTSAPGYYATSVGPVLVKASGEDLYAILANRKFGMEPYADGTFGLYDRILGLYKIRIGSPNTSYAFKKIDGHEVVVAYLPYWSLVIGQKITPRSIPAAWKQRLGRYEVVNPDKAIPIGQVRLEEHDQFLQVHMNIGIPGSKAVTTTLLPVTANDAIIARLGRGGQETVHASIRHGVTYLSYSGLDFRLIKSAR